MILLLKSISKQGIESHPNSRACKEPTPSLAPFRAPSTLWEKKTTWFVSSGTPKALHKECGHKCRKLLSCCRAGTVVRAEGAVWLCVRWWAFPHSSCSLLRWALEANAVAVHRHQQHLSDHTVRGKIIQTELFISRHLTVIQPVLTFLELPVPFVIIQDHVFAFRFFLTNAMFFYFVLTKRATPLYPSPSPPKMPFTNIEKLKTWWWHVNLVELLWNIAFEIKLLQDDFVVIAWLLAK